MRAMLEKIYKTIYTPFLDDYHRWVLWCPVLIACGVGCYFALATEPSQIIITYTTLILMLGFVVCRKHPPARYFLIVVICMSVGMLAGSLRTTNHGTAMIQDEIGPLMVIGQVAQIDHETSAVKILLQDVSFETRQRALDGQNIPTKVRIRLPKSYAVPEIGARIEILSILRPPSAPVAPRSYDFQRHMYFQQIGATGYAVRAFNQIAAASPKTGNLARIAEKQRENIKSRILNVDADKTAKAVLIALLTGERKLIDKETWESIRKSGIAHLLAISGLHIGLIAGFIFFVIRAVLALIPYTALYWPIKKMSACGAFLGILSYCWLVGAPVSAERAVIMTGIVLFGVMIDRVAISLRLAAFAASVILMIAPEMLFTPGFQMSFSAVVCLVAFYEAFRWRFQSFLYQRGVLQKIAVYILATILTTVIASIATAPFALYHFQRVAMLPSLLANVVSVPLTAFFIMPVGIVILGGFMLGAKMEWLIEVNTKAIEIILETAQYTADMRGSVWSMGAWPMTGLLAIVIGALWLIIWQNRQRYLGVIGIIIGLALITTMQHPHVLISETGKLIAIYDQGLEAKTVYFSSKRGERFTRNIWQQEYGAENVMLWHEAVLDRAEEGASLVCDEQGCLYNIEEQLKLSFPKTQMASYQDCATSPVMPDLIIAPEFYTLAETCAHKATITRTDLKEKGSHAIYVDRYSVEGHDGKQRSNLTYRIETSQDVRGVRPWTIYKRPFKKDFK